MYAPGQRPWSQLNSNWQGIVDTTANLPNVAGSDTQMGVPTVQHGDLAWVATGAVGLYQCIDPTQGAAVWALIGAGSGSGPAAPDFEWNLNGTLSLFSPQFGTFGGLPTFAPGLSGPGPFDGTRLSRRVGTLTTMGLIIRVPASVPGGTTFVEFYRIRAGLVTSLGVLGLPTLAPTSFSIIAAVPAPTDMALGDMFFVSLAGTAPAGAADLSAFILVAP